MSGFSWRIIVSPKAGAQLKRLGSVERKRINRFIDERIRPSNEPEKLGKALVGKFLGYWRFRVGDYRIIAKIERNQLIILVLEIAHRSEICR